MGRVVVLGSSNTDLVIELPRLPIAGETILGGTFRRGAGGKGANQAVAAQRSRSAKSPPVMLIAALGDDDLGGDALTRFRKEGFNTSAITVIKGRPSGVALIFVGNNGENLIGVAPGANAMLLPDHINMVQNSMFEHNSIFLVGLEIPLPTVARGVERAATAGMRIVLNPAPAPAAHDLLSLGILPRVEICTPNRSEAAHLVGHPVETPEQLRAAAAVMHGWGIAAVLITLGGDGLFLSHAQLAPEGQFFPVFPAKVVDTVGAGDAFNGALATALAEGRDLPDAVRFANAAAALTVSRPGAQDAIPSRAEIERLLKQ